MQNANVGPVFLAYRHGEAITKLIAEVAAGEPYKSVVMEDGFGHSLWRVPPQHADLLIDEFAQLDCTYVADGHHRT